MIAMISIRILFSEPEILGIVSKGPFWMYPACDFWQLKNEESDDQAFG